MWLFKYPMTVKEVKDAMVRKTEKDWFIPVQIKVDWCFLIMHAVEILDKSVVDKTETEDAVLIKRIKDDPYKYYNPRWWKINLCNYVKEYKEKKHFRNQWYYDKYKKRLFEPDVNDREDSNYIKEKADSINLDNMKGLIISEDD